LKNVEEKKLTQGAPERFAHLQIQILLLAFQQALNLLIQYDAETMLLNSKE
jgi:hypothetical protein